MSVLTPSSADGLRSAATRLHRREWLVILGRACRTGRGRIGLAVTAFVVLVAVVGAFWTPQSPTAFTLQTLATPSSHNLLGTDILARDVLSRLLAGGWVLLVMALAATVIGVGLGALNGIQAAYLGGRADSVIMRSMDVFLAFPQIVLALLLVSTVGSKLWLIVLAVGLGHVPQVARVIRGAALEISERDYVKAVELQGASSLRIMTREILPNLVSPMMVEIGLRLTFSIVIIASLAYLGFGQQPPAASWGIMIYENRIGLEANPWAVVAPAAMIALLTIGVNTFTDAVARVAIRAEGRSALETTRRTMALGGQT